MAERGTEADITTAPQNRPPSAVEILRNQREVKTIMDRAPVGLRLAPGVLVLIAVAFFYFGSGTGWFILGIPFVLLAGLVSIAIPFAVPALYLLGAWRLSRTQSRMVGPAARANTGTPPAPALAAAVEMVEQLRSQLAAEARRRAMIGVPLGLGAMTLLIWFTVGQDPSSSKSPAITYLMLPMLGVVGPLIWAYHARLKRYSLEFKSSILPHLLATYGELVHTIGTSPDLAPAIAAKFMHAPDHVSADDAIIGSYRGLPIRITELSTTKEIGDNTETLFEGLYVEITVSSPFLGVTMVLDRARAHLPNSLQRLTLESNVFGEIYSVWASDQIEGRAVLTPAVMERLLKMADGTSFLPPLFWIQGSRMTFALPAISPGSLFEPGGFGKSVAIEHLASVQADLKDVFALADAMIDMHGLVRAPRAHSTPARPSLA
ncbi:MAG: hypothetical protein DCF30_10700 [Hyphomicrobiales bacterium]|nr:MAG: hypothetical protein DCF30_10700 [Hyphomicrobiales bacterium]